MEEEFCDLLRTVDSTGRGSLCYNGECWAVSLVHHYEPILETLIVTHRFYLNFKGFFEKKSIAFFSSRYVKAVGQF